MKASNAPSESSGLAIVDEPAPAIAAERTPRMTLYDVGMEGLIISDILTESEGELTPELEARLDELMKKGPDRVEAAAMIVRQLTADADACKNESARLSERAKMFERQVASLKARMVFAVDAAFGGKIKTPRFTIWTQKAQDSLDVSLAEGFTVDMVRADHPELIKTEFSLNTSAARALWEQHGATVKAARECLADPEAPAEAKSAALEMLKAIPECLSFEEKQGKRYLRVK